MTLKMRTLHEDNLESNPRAANKVNPQFQAILYWLSFWTVSIIYGIMKLQPWPSSSVTPIVFRSVIVVVVPLETLRSFRNALVLLPWSPSFQGLTADNKVWTRGTGGSHRTEINKLDLCRYNQRNLRAQKNK